MTFTTASTADIILLSACSFAGNTGKAITGFGMAIIYLFVWQIAELAGYEGDFKYAVFIQSLALLSIQPIALYNAQVIKNSYRRILLLFIPITLISTPLGQLLSEHVPTKTVQSVAGVLVLVVALWEVYSKRSFFMSLCKSKKQEDEGGEIKKEELKDVAKLEKEDEDNFADNAIASSQLDEEIMVEEDAEDNDDGPSDAPPRSTFLNLGLGAYEVSRREPNLGIDVSPATKKSNNQEPMDELKIGPNKATFFTLLAGGASGFLGGMVAIRGPPLIFYFLHPPHPVSFNKSTQRATATVITFCNVFMRQAFYIYHTFSGSDQIGYQKEDW
eukprot:CAMPEP_0172314472 /NCGR_PEP_ID=MMETSP1058-20130122/22624_1 /TAXON_ID=83371 /ORGANISM="Detonula confervacea, Strain CCMP 353" /LENGTH=329 /DNA_ID=CAMNT_0013028353 /DNA_START=49 /DNA_END=1035 /DNA_ORIENTATION=+